jgi:SagB-type dehydrogenase family enzyme
MTNTNETFVNMLAARPEIQTPRLYEIYHENTKMHPLLEARVVNAESNPNAGLNQEINKIAIAEIESTVSTGGKKYPTAKQVRLINCLDRIKHVSLTDIIVKRESVREFETKALSLEELSILCQLTYGWNRDRDIEIDEGTISYRYAPSPGRLYPLELYLVTPHEFKYQSDNDCDIWHYEPSSHALERIDRVKETQIRDAFVQFPTSLPPVVALLTGVIPRLTWKYGDRAYRYAHLEAGHVGQNLILAAEALNLGACPIVSFYDDAIHDLLDVDGVSEIALYTFFIGYPASTS